MSEDFVTTLKKQYNMLNINDKVFDFCNGIWDGLKDRFDEIDRVSELNQLKVLKAFQNNRISDAHLTGSNGYGYTDIGRDSLEKVYADVFILRMHL